METQRIYRIIKLEPFDKWLEKQEKLLRQRIVSRLVQIEKLGYFGDCKSVGDGLFELRFHVPGGVRIYYYREHDKLVILLGGGDKDSQKRDIEKAKGLMNQLKGE